VYELHVRSIKAVMVYRSGLNFLKFSLMQNCKCAFMGIIKL
jgi:hypothetical protein